MAPFRFPLSAAALAATVVLTGGGAKAITAKDVLEKMTEKERFGYITGLVDMLSYQSVLAGNRTRAECVSKTFYDNAESSWKLLVALFEKYADKSPEGLVIVFMTRSCGG
jgi:peptide methionine sulfoxide reductase MsrA